MIEYIIMPSLLLLVVFIVLLCCIFFFFSPPPPPPPLYLLLHLHNTTSPSNATRLSTNSDIQIHLSPRARVRIMGYPNCNPWLTAYLFASVLLCCASTCMCTPVAFKGYDVIECAHKGECKVGSPKFATNYTSLDIDGTPRFIAEFRFVSVDNMIAFENAPFSYAPKYGGFCSYGIWKNGNEKPVWGRNKVGPSADVEKGWRLVRDNTTGTVDIYLFGGSKGADAFVRNLPDSKILADKVWETMWGRHGTTPPYAQHGGPFNKVCFTGGTRDCNHDPQKLPPPSSATS